MKTASAIGLSIIFSACFSLLAMAQVIPEPDECARVHLRTSQGWWIEIKRDDSGSYGFGTQVGRVEAEQGTFDFRFLYDETRQATAETRADATAPYIAVSYYASGSSSAREYYLSKSPQWLAALFLAARDNTLPPANEFEQSYHERIEVFWQKNPYPSSNSSHSAD